MRRLVVIAIGWLVLAMGGCVTSPYAPPSFDVTGTWTGTWAFEPESAGGGQITMILAQKREFVSGSLRVVGPQIDRQASFEGVMTGNEIRLTGEFGSGWLTVNGNDMTGHINSVVPTNLALRRLR